MWQEAQKKLEGDRTLTDTKVKQRQIVCERRKIAMVGALSFG